MLENGALQELSIMIRTASSRNTLTYLKGLIVRKLDRAISSGSSAETTLISASAVALWGELARQ